MAAALSGFSFKHLIAVSAFIAIGLTPVEPAGAQATRQQSACDIQSGARPDVVISSCTALIQSGRDTGRNLAAAFTVRGRAYRGLGDLDRAIADYSEAIRIDPNYVLAVYSRGIAYFNKGDNDRAIADYSEALRLTPRDIIALQNRGHAYQAKREYDRAIADYAEAIRIAPRFAWAFNDRCYARALAGRELQQALADCDEALRLSPNDSSFASAVLDSRGLTHLRLGEFDQAIADYNAVLMVNPKKGMSLYGRGLAKQKKGDKAGGDADIAAAKAIRVGIAEEFARYGVE